MEVLLLMVDLIAMFLLVRWSARTDSKLREQQASRANEPRP